MDNLKNNGGYSPDEFHDAVEVLNVERDDTALSSHDPLIGPPNDPLIGSPNDPLIGYPNDALIGSPNDPLIGSPNDPLIGSPNVPLIGSPNDHFIGSPSTPSVDQNDSARPSTDSSSTTVAVEPCLVNNPSESQTRIRTVAQSSEMVSSDKQVKYSPVVQQWQCGSSTTSYPSTPSSSLVNDSLASGEVQSTISTHVSAVTEAITAVTNPITAVNEPITAVTEPIPPDELRKPTTETVDRESTTENVDLDRESTSVKNTVEPTAVTNNTEYIAVIDNGKLSVANNRENVTESDNRELSAIKGVCESESVRNIVNSTTILETNPPLVIASDKQVTSRTLLEPNDKELTAVVEKTTNAVGDISKLTISSGNDELEGAKNRDSPIKYGQETEKQVTDIGEPAVPPVAEEEPAAERPSNFRKLALMLKLQTEMARMQLAMSKMQDSMRAANAALREVMDDAYD